MLPEFAFFDIGGAEFPVLFRLVDAGEETLALLLLREMKEEFDDAGAVGVEMPFQIRDRPIAIVPKVFVVMRRVGSPSLEENVAMHADDQHLLVIGSIEDADPSALRQIAGRAP